MTEDQPDWITKHWAACGQGDCSWDGPEHGCEHRKPCDGVEAATSDGEGHVAAAGHRYYVIHTFPSNGCQE